MNYAYSFTAAWRLTVPHNQVCFKVEMAESGSFNLANPKEELTHKTITLLKPLLRSASPVSQCPVFLSTSSGPAWHRFWSV